MSRTITCPQCENELEISEVMSAQIASGIRSELQAEYAAKQRKLSTEREQLAEQQKELETSQAGLEDRVQEAVAKERKAITGKVRVEAQQAVAVEIADRDEQLKANKAKLKAYESQELDLRKKARDLEEKAEKQELEITRRIDEERKTVQDKLQAEYAEKSKKLTADREGLVKERERLEASLAEMDQQVQAAVAKEREKLAKKLRAEAEQATAVEIADREERLKASQAKLKAFETQELELRKKARDLEEKTEQQELEVVRRIDEERKKVREVALKQAHEENQLKQAEKEEVIKGLLNKLEEMKRKAEQGSQQTQGEVQEIALENLLEEAFPHDVIEPIAKGAKGADVLQHVFDGNGREVGTILWESKRTKAWKNDWVGKAIDDQQAAKASVVCIVSAALPNDMDRIDQKSGVWIAGWSSKGLIAGLLRQTVLEVAQARAATEGQHGKMEMLYNYMASDELRSRLRGIVEPFQEMEKDLESEMRVINARWKKRRKQIDRVMMSASGMYGDVQGIIGSGLQEIEAMEMLALEGEDEVEQNENANNKEVV